LALFSAIAHSTSSVIGPIPVFTLFYRLPQCPFRFCSTYWVLGVALVRLRLPTRTRGLVGSPHGHSSCLAPVGELRRYVNVPPPAGPPGSRPGFCPLQVCIKAISAKTIEVVLPAWAHGPDPSFIPAVVTAPPRGGGSHSGTSPVLGRSSLLFLSPSFVTLCTHRLHSFVTPCTHRRLHSPRCALITHRLHSPRCAPLSLTHRFHLPRSAGVVCVCVCGGGGGVGTSTQQNG
jgi:hypothetical protein